MKKITFLIAFLAYFGLVKSQYVSLDVEGTILCSNRTLQGALVNVMRDGKPFTSFLTDIDGSYNLYLPLGSEYIVTISKKDYVKKMYTVSTVGVPAESAQKKFPIIVADVELFEYFEGVDYSVFNQPMNKYYFNVKKDNFEYDKAYLKHMLAMVDELRRDEKRAMLAAASKAKRLEKQNANVASVTTVEKTAVAVEAPKIIEPEKVVPQPVVEKSIVGQTSNISNSVKEKLPVNDATAVKVPRSEKITALLARYKPGVTEEIIQGPGMVIIQRVVVRDEMAWVYQKKIFSWGGVACFRDGVSITESAFDHETKKYI